MLSHKLAKALEQANTLWEPKAKMHRSYSAYSLDSFQDDMNKFLDESSRPHDNPVGKHQHAVSQDKHDKKGHVFTKLHKKIALS